jgi:iron-sulfur cluster assembly accessory protein
MNIAITPAAEKFIRRMIRFRGTPSGGFRLAVTPGGCSGLAADFSVESEPRAGEAVLEQNGLKLFLPPESRLLLNGLTMDFADTPAESGLVFRDPKASASSCGTRASAPAELVSLTNFGSQR